jgi:two-component sensor histidine kinase
VGLTGDFRLQSYVSLLNFKNIGLSPNPVSAILPTYFRDLSRFALLVGFGLLGNYFKYPLFLNIDFLFGSIFAMVALQVFGWGRGVLAAAIIASYTIVLWNHPYYLVIVTAEVAVVGFLTARYKLGLVLADAVYWVAIGMPLSYLLYRGALDVPAANAFLVTCKSAINGIANALVARLLVTGLSVWLSDKKVAYRDITYNLLTLFALAPALTLMVLASHADFHEIDKDIRTDLSADGQSMARRIDVWLQNRIFAATHLARMASQRTPSEMQAPLEQAQASDPNFSRVTLINANGLSVAISPLVDELGRSNLGRNYADRPFIPRLKQTLKPMVSEVVVSRVEAQKPIALVVSPVVVQGEYAGFIAGILSLSQIEDFVASNVKGTHVRYALIDKNDNIILTNHPDQKVMTPLRRGDGVQIPFDGQVSQWVPQLAAGKPTMERWTSSVYIVETKVGSLAEWTLILEQPMAPFQKILFERYANALVILLIILLISLVLAEVISRKAIKSLEDLSSLTVALPAKLAQTKAGVVWPQTTIAEIMQLIDNFKHMANSLSQQFVVIRQSNELLESRVQQRTAELQVMVHDKEALLQEVHHRVKNNLQVIASLLRLETRRSPQTETRAVLRDMQGRIHAMSLLHESLYRSGTFASVDLGAYLTQLARQVFSTQKQKGEVVELRLQLVSSDMSVSVGMDQAIPCGLLVNELISNSLKHGFPNDHSGEISVALQALDGQAEQWRLSVTDTGVGLAPDFEDRRKISLGLQLAGDLAKQLGGALEIVGNPVNGVVVSVTFKAIRPTPLVMPI